jgi:cell division protein FtsA
MSDYIIGIDIGSSKVCAAMGKVDKLGNLQIVGAASSKCYGVKKSMVIDIETTAAAIAKCKHQLETMTDETIDEAYLSIPGGLCDLVFTKGVVAVSSDDREIVNKDVERVLNAAKIISISSDKEIVGIIPDRYSVDGHDNIMDPVGMNGMRLEVDAKIAVAQSSAISNLLKSMQGAGIRVIDVILQPIALSSLCLSQEDKNMSLALVNIGADAIDLSIYKGGNICYTNLIPLGGSAITNDIAKCLRVSFSEAENLKNTFGDVKVSESISKDSIVVNSAYSENMNIDKSLLIEIIKARVEELLLFIKEDMIQQGYYEEIATVFITGGAISMFKGTAEFGKTILGKPVRIVNPGYAGVSSPAYATAVGVVKRAFDAQKLNKTVHDESDWNFEEKHSANRSKGSNKLISKIRDIIDEFF